MSRDGWRPHIESATALDIWLLAKNGYLRNGARGVLHWTRDGEQFGAVSYAVELNDHFGTLTLSYSCEKRDGEREDVACKIRLSSLPLHFGGRRWYGHCPYTHRRARKLYKFYGIAQFCHRTAIRPLPTYSIQRVSGISRVQAQRWSIRQKLGDDFSSLFDAPCKPKWMRWKTFERFAQRDAALSYQEDGYLSPYLYRMLKNDGLVS